MLIVWCAGQLYGALAPPKALRTPEARRLWATLLILLFVGVPAFLIPFSGLRNEERAHELKAQLAAGQHAPAAPADSPAPAAALVAEEVFARQPALLDQALSRLAPGEPGHPHVYFLAFAPDGGQADSLRRAEAGARLFESRFGAARRTLVLANSRDSADTVPLASGTNLNYVLQRLGRIMLTDQDILFLSLSGRGRADAQMPVQLDSLGFRPLSAGGLAAMIEDSGIRWRVVVVSSCYAASLLPALKDDRALVIAAASSGRKAFECTQNGGTAQFDRAFFDDALSQTTSFTEAFGRAQTEVGQWESDSREEHSEPQMATGALIEGQLERWRKALPQPR